MKPIYLDYAATTPVDPRVAGIMHECLTQEGVFGNSSSQHFYGKEAKQIVENARADVAQLFNAEPGEIIWTSGATESNNLAIKGVAHLYKRKGKHIVTMKTEHKSVLDACQHLEKEGYSVTYLDPEPSGLLDIEKFKAALQPETILVSIMHVNNETGIIQDIQAIANVTSQRQIFLHVDAAQSAGKLSIDTQQTPIDLMSFCAHKIYGPKGIGGLYLRKKPRVRVEPFIHGGGHEQGMRSGTLATHQIVGLSTALILAHEVLQTDFDHITKLRERFLQGLKALPKVILNTDITNATPYILNLRFEGMIADAILADLPEIAASTASACQGQGTEGSYVLRAMDLSNEQIKSSIRFSFGRFTTIEMVDAATQAICQLLQRSI